MVDPWDRRDQPAHTYPGGIDRGEIVVLDTPSSLKVCCCSSRSR
jgi:hypothetical protein